MPSCQDHHEFRNKYDNGIYTSWTIAVYNSRAFLTSVGYILLSDVPATWMLCHVDTHTGSVGATVRMYIEKYEPDVSKQSLMTADVLRPLVDIGLRISKLVEFTGRESPTVIT